MALMLLAGGSKVFAEGPSRHPRPVEVRGVLTVLQEDDFAGDRSRRLHEVTDERSGRRYALRFERPGFAGLRTGEQVVVRGRLRGGEILVGARDEGVEVLPASTTAAATQGARTVVVLMVDFADAAVACTDAAVGELMFAEDRSVAALYREASDGRLRIEGDADGDGRPDVFRVTLTDRIGDRCDPYAWALAAERAATAQGLDLSPYRHRVLVLPQQARCGWAGLGNVGCGLYCRAWIRNCALGDLYAHEIGHNLGMAHASTDDDNDGTIDCEYCDRSDIMGSGGFGWRGLNAPHEQQHGWLPPQAVVALERPGTRVHVLSPLGDDPAGAAFPQVLTVPLPVAGESYHVSYRLRAGVDATMDERYAGRTSIHRWTGDGHERTVLVGVLSDGQTFRDAAAGLTVTQLAHDGVGATVEVEGRCAPAPPAVSIAPSTSYGRPGATAELAVSVLNRDAPFCEPSTLRLAPSAPAGWRVSPAATELTLAPGERGQATVSVTSPWDARDGASPVRVSLDDAERPEHRVTAEAHHVVDGTPPSRVGDLRAFPAAGAVHLLWSAAEDGAGSGIAVYRVWRDGEPLGTTPAPGWVDRSPSPGLPHAYRVTAVDRAGNESEPGNRATVGRVPQSGQGGGRERPSRHRY